MNCVLITLAPQAIADMLTRLEANFDRKLNDQFQLIQQLSASVAEHHMHSNGSQGEHYDGERNKDVTSHGQDKEPEEQQALGTRGSWDSSTYCFFLACVREIKYHQTINYFH
jgi:hypothetical protein